MHFPTKQPPYMYTVVFLFFFFSVVFSDPRTTKARLFCGGGANRSSANPNYIPTFTREMQSLSQQITTHHFATHSVNSTPFPGSKTATPTITIYALAQCHADLSQTDCLLCYAVARTRLPRCLPSVAAQIFLDGCFLRYDDYNFYGESVSDDSDASVCSNDTVSAELVVEFRAQVDVALEEAVRAAEGNGGFGVGLGGKSGAHALAQCWESVGKEGCRECMEKGVREVKRCVPKREGRGMNAGCYVRYSDHKFFNDGQRVAHGIHTRGVIIAIGLATFAFFMLFLSATYAILSRISKTKQERRNLGLLSKSFNKSRIKFRYETLEKATDYFSQKKWLGQGGNGTVFMGVLPNGQRLAVKRLVFNTRQWVDEFFNEVNLISGIHHKNLVKLLGCSIEGPESLLVYEFVPNKSLDHFLFGEKRTKILSWKERLNIIVGTAEGLDYLHRGSPVRIIHRDIKTSNILLDHHLTPKIADFGLARCFGSDQTHLSTGIAGTLGYMAPEYVVRGQLTEKADIYSFGVLVLEIACGKRNSVFEPESGSLLQRVWKLYRQDRLIEALDPSLKDELLQTEDKTTEACNVLLVGLLCTQASATLRPSLEKVIKMLTKRDFHIPAPEHPPFMNIGSVAEPENSTSSCSTNSTMSNTAVKTDLASQAFSESSRTLRN